MLLNRNPANIRKWIIVCTLSILPLEAHYYVLTIIAWVAHRYPGSSIYIINILLGSFLVFCIVISHSLWGWNNPVQRCLPVGGGCIIHAGGVVASRTDWRSTTCNRRRPAATSSHGNLISALASANSFVFFTASSAATSRWRICMSVIAAFANFSSLAFCRAGLCR